jgi:hypothetical protein
MPKIERKTIGLSLSEKQKLEAIQHFLREEGDAEFKNINHVYRLITNYYYKNVVLRKTKRKEREI